MDRSMNSTQYTPTSGEQDKRTIAVRTPLSGMSSSLKERLKKCGRYHPFTPPGNRHMTPTPMVTCTSPDPPTPPITGLRDREHGSPQLASTPPCHQSTGPTHSPLSSKRTLPQPRNLLKENSLSQSSQEQKGAKRCKTETVVGDKTFVIEDPNKKESKLISADEMCVHAENSSFNPECSSASETDALSGASADALDAETVSSQLKKKQSEASRKHVIQKADVSDVASAVELKETKKALTADLAHQKETLRKLLLIKTYRAKHSLGQLQALIDKWRSVSQEAILDLHQLTRDPRPSLTQLVRQLGVDWQLLRYNEEDECFED